MSLNVVMAPSVAPIGSKLTINENGEYNVTDYAVAEVNVSGGGGGSSDFITVTMSNTSDPDGLAIVVAKTTGLEMVTVLSTPQEFELVGSASALILPFGMYDNVTGAEPYGDTEFLSVIDGATVVLS